MARAGDDTIWIFGDQLNREIASLEHAEPGRDRILMVESEHALVGRRWHRQRLHLVLTSMRRFARELEQAGFDVDHRRAPTLQQGLEEHRRRYSPPTVRAMEPRSYDLWERLDDWGVEQARSNQYLCHAEDFRAWADDRPSLRMEDFYRWQRRRLGALMDDDEPAGGRWNFDSENREPPPKDGGDWPEPVESALDDLDREVIDGLPDDCFGAEPDGTWATSRRAALTRLRHFVEHGLPGFGPHQDAMTTSSWHLSHALLSPYLNLGMLTPDEVWRAAEQAYREGRVPLASAEGFVRQIIGWREFIWGVYWLWMPGYRRENKLRARRRLPVAFHDPDKTEMRCLSETVRGIERHAYAHHIQRLMILGNLAMLAAVEPRQLVEWMWTSFIDGAEWVMLPNVVSMALYADEGRMTTKPYAAGGAYVNRMSDYCKSCRFRPDRRTGDDACPFTTLYWDFMARHRERLAGNHRVARQIRTLDRLSDLDEVRKRARTVLHGLSHGTL